MRHIVLRGPEARQGLPTPVPPLRGVLEHWIEHLGLRPKVVAELDDPALAKVVGEAGWGVFAAPAVVEKEIQQRYDVQLVGRVADLRQRFYAISLERKIRHPAVLAITEASRKHVFA